jgi:hypothetical protein
MDTTNNIPMNVKPKIRVITFGAGSQGIERSLQRLKNQAKKFSWFDEVITHSEASLGNDYFSALSRGVLLNPKGFGLWSWKPYIIERELKSMNEGDILVYLDAGVEINQRGSSRFTYYLDHLAREDVLVFSLDHQHRQWTKLDTRIFDYGQNYFRNQVVAGVLMFRVSPKSLGIVSRWKDLCFLDGGQLLEDPSLEQNQQHYDLIEHRHDQSVLSKVVFDTGIPTLPDETIFIPWRRGRNFPFLALRNKSSALSWLSWVFITPFFFWRAVYVISNPDLVRKFTKKLLPKNYKNRLRQK